MENFIYLKTFYLNTKTCRTCGHKGHKFSHCGHGGGNYSKNKKLVQFSTEQATIEKVQRKCINICFNNKEKNKFQIDMRSDLTIINVETWKKIKCPTLCNSKKIAKGVTREKLKLTGETFINVFFNGKERKLKAFVFRNAQNLFWMDWME